jgi:hypothetical protein
VACASVGRKSLHPISASRSYSASPKAKRNPTLPGATTSARRRSVDWRPAALSCKARPACEAAAVDSEKPVGAFCAGGTHRRPRLSSHPPPSVGVPSRANGSPPASSFESTGRNGFLTSAKMSHTPKGVIRPVTLVQVPNALSRQKLVGPAPAPCLCRAHNILISRSFLAAAPHAPDRNSRPRPALVLNRGRIATVPTKSTI